MTAANGDRITVQRVTSTVAGEYLEWTVTVRRSSPAGVGDPLHAFQVELPVEVRDALIAWLETPVARHVVLGGRSPRSRAEYSPGGRIPAQEGVQPQDGAPLLAGRDFAVGDRVRGEEPAPGFPFGRTAPAAPYAGRTAPRRTAPPEAPVRLWNLDYTDHLDVIGWATSTAANSVELRIRDKQADTANAWIDAQVEADQPVFVVWLDREWTLDGVVASAVAGLSIKLGPVPKPPRVDQALGRTADFDPGPTPAERPGYTVADLTAMKDQITKGYMESRGLDKARCPGCTNPTEHGHYPYCPQAHGYPVAEPDPVAGFAGRLNTMRQAMSAALEPDDEPGPAIKNLGGTLTIPLEPHTGPVDPVADEKPTALFQPKAQPEFIGTVTSGLIHAEEDDPEGVPERCGFTVGGHRCVWDEGHDSGHSVAGPGGTWKVPEPDVDVVLPMPGGPNDKLAQAARPPFCGAVDPRPLRNGGSYACTRPPAHTGDHAAHISQDGAPVSVWPNDVTAPGPYGDLYARLDAIHDATAEEDQ